MVRRGGITQRRDAQGAGIFTWQQAWWEEQGKACIGECAADIKGLQAYAARQANIRCRLADHFHVLWALFLSL
jgi:hypothetical protein